jgi:tRNA uridine 5-carbamoylmethylation protein Kti12
MNNYKLLFSLAIFSFALSNNVIAQDSDEASEEISTVEALLLLVKKATNKKKRYTRKNKTNEKTK